MTIERPAVPNGFPAYCADCPSYHPDNPPKQRCEVFTHTRLVKGIATYDVFRPILDADGICRAHGLALEECYGCRRLLSPEEVAARPKTRAWCAECAEEREFGEEVEEATP
jgi:hypothetical protein